MVNRSPLNFLKCANHCGLKGRVSTQVSYKDLEEYVGPLNIQRGFDCKPSVNMCEKPFFEPQPQIMLKQDFMLKPPFLKNIIMPKILC